MNWQQFRWKVWNSSVFSCSNFKRNDFIYTSWVGKTTVNHSLQVISTPTLVLKSQVMINFFRRHTIIFLSLVSCSVQSDNLLSHIYYLFLCIYLINSYFVLAWYNIKIKTFQLEMYIWLDNTEVFGYRHLLFNLTFFNVGNGQNPSLRFVSFTVCVKEVSLLSKVRGNSLLDNCQWKRCLHWKISITVSGEMYWLADDCL